MKKDILALMVYVVLFGLVLLASLYSLILGLRIINVGLSAVYVDFFVAVLSAFGLLKSLWHLVRT